MGTFLAFIGIFFVCLLIENPGLATFIFELAALLFIRVVPIGFVILLMIGVIMMKKNWDDNAQIQVSTQQHNQVDLYSIPGVIPANNSNCFVNSIDNKTYCKDEQPVQQVILNEPI